MKGRLCFDEGDAEEGKRLCMEAIKVDEKFVEAYTDLGWSECKRDNFDNAMKYYK